MLRILIALAAAALMAMPAFAGYRYRVIDLGVLSEHEDGRSTAYGINNSGQVCGETTVDVSETVRGQVAFLWLPQEVSGWPVTTQGMHALTSLDSNGEPETIARRISDAGRIAGYFDGPYDGAFVWVPEDVYDLVAGVTMLDAMNGTYDRGSQAWSVADEHGEAPFRVAGVGWASSPACVDPPELDPCCCCCLEGGIYYHCSDGVAMAFAWNADTQEFTQFRGAAFTSAFNAGAHGHGISDIEDLHVVGYSRTCANVEIPCNEEASSWKPSSIVPTTGLVSDTIAGAVYSIARDINKSEFIVGAVHVATPQVACGRALAAFWEDRGANPVNLGVLPPLSECDPEEIDCVELEGCCPANGSIAYAINDAFLPQVVGAANVGANDGFAVLWHYDGADWWAENLNDLINPSTLLDLKEAHDINDAGWITGLGLDAFNAQRAFLLVPYGPCPADVNRDGCINFDDILAILISYEGCPPSTICWADVNDDYTVNFDDILEVLLAYCGEEGGPCCAGCLEPESFGGGGGPPSDQEVLEFIIEHATCAQAIVDAVASLSAQDD